MTFDEAIAAIRARAPIAAFEEEAKTQGRDVKEETAYQLAKWARKNGTDEELTAIGLRR